MTNSLRDSLGLETVGGLLLLLYLGITSEVWAACDALYPKNTPIKVENTVELCSSFYVSVYSPQTKAVIYVAETVDTSKEGAPRLSSFRPDPRLPPSQRASLSDYQGSPYDRGHMAPAADAKTPTEMSESFLLTNMTPQNPTLNRGAWRKLESYIRTLCVCTLKIVTGAIYERPAPTIGGNNIPVPTAYYKIVWLPTGKSRGFMANNSEEAEVYDASLEDIQGLAGIAFE